MEWAKARRLVLLVLMIDCCSQIAFFQYLASSDPRAPQKIE
jgi:hypothetical protein